MFEPRGHDMMSGSILYPPTRPDCDVAVLFIETSGCLPMCGHGTIGTITMGIENGLITPREPGKLLDRCARRQGDISYRQDGPFRRGGPADQRARLPLCRRADGSRSRVSAH
jgi:4-hydroxyproline epimerase